MADHTKHTISADEYNEMHHWTSSYVDPALTLDEQVTSENADPNLVSLIDNFTDKIKAQFNTPVDPSTLNNVPSVTEAVRQIVRTRDPFTIEKIFYEENKKADIKLVFSFNDITYTARIAFEATDDQIYVKILFFRSTFTRGHDETMALGYTRESLLSDETLKYYKTQILQLVSL
jgi:hypothetical protein